MEWFQVFVIAVLQGATEFLPISSSGHLILLPIFTQWEDQGLVFDVSVHLGTLIAVVVYFRKDLSIMIRDWFGSISGQGQTIHSYLVWNISFATLFVGVAGLLFQDFISVQLRSPVVIGITSIIFALVLAYADKKGKQIYTIKDVGFKQALIIGFAQAIALIPGTSRSGIILSAGLLLGLNRQSAARFSFLMAIPVIILASTLYIVQLTTTNRPVPWPLLIFATSVSAISALVCIHYFLRYLEKFGLMPFVYYRLVLGALLLYLFL